jgi:hypothetical protein
MNCKTFQTILQDLGKDASLDLQTRQDSLAHAEVCPNCAALLRDECRLTAGLNALAASLADAEASPRVEAALLNAFRARGIKQEARPEARWTLPNSTGEHLSSGRDSRFRNSLPIRVAAASLLAAGLAAWFGWQSSNRKPAMVIDQIRPSLPQEVSRGVTPKISLPQTTGVSQTESPRSPRPKAVSRSTRKPRVQTPLLHQTDQSDLRQADVQAYDTLDQTEVATEFMPLSYGEPFSPSLQGGQLVRVQLPRTTLLSFGFPMSAERAPEPIKADVLLGEDGMARAIRFVHSVE